MAWLGLSGNGPLAAMPATALAPSSALEDLIAVTQSAESTDVTNGFMTDADGNGELSLELDFMLVGLILLTAIART